MPQTGTVRPSSVLAGLLLLGVLAGCGTSSTQDDTVSSGGVLPAAYEATSAAHTARTQIRTRSSQGTSGASSSSATTADGVLDLATGDLDLTTDTPAGQTETRRVGGTTYTRLPSTSVLPGGKAWLAVALPEGPSGGSSGDPAAFLSLLKGATDSVDRVGSDTVRGVRATHYRGVLDLARLTTAEGAPAPLVGAPGQPLPMDVWVDASQRVVRLQIVTPIVVYTGSYVPLTSPAPAGVTATASPRPPAGPSVSGSSTSTEEFYDFGVAVHVVAPPADQVQTAPAVTQYLSGTLTAPPPVVVASPIGPGGLPGTVTPTLAPPPDPVPTAAPPVVSPPVPLPPGGVLTAAPPALPVPSYSPG